MAQRRTVPWSNEEVGTFLSLVADERIQRELDGATRNEKVYQEVSRLLAFHGYVRTFVQCWEKLKKLKSDYRSIKDHNGRSGSNRKNWRWFEVMDSIYGHRPANSGREGGLDSATSILESLTEDDYILELEEMPVDEHGPMTPAAVVPTASTASEFEPPRAATPATVETPRAATPAPAGSASAPIRRKRQREPEHVTVLRDMQASDVEQQELNREQRERHVQAALDDAREARELEASLRREEIAATAAFNQAFLATLGQLVQALSSQHGSVTPPLD
ncbi:Zinc finger and SCAN domain-containing protein 29 [Collichthys lucidus]|uniref:Zinc finger and SCAN domain-containing protein 29 n=1 Tax=Collichthys lucidus TaxID=240159 RepID=A0A4U5U8U2_COLLU|nr:Zinc finger and SCAN domain-containing protein 29 [Collichthys lucidus]